MAAKKTKAPARPAADVPPIEAVLAAIVEPKKIPPIVVVADVPPLSWADGRTVSPEETLSVLRAAVSEKLDEDLGRRLRDALAREGADAFAVHLLDRWKTKELHGRYEWILGAAAALGGDRTALALEPLIVGWSEAGETGRKRAIAALPALRRIGTDTALLVLMGLRQKAVKPSVMEAAIDTLKDATKDRGVSLSELADRITPTLGLDARGMRTLSYGPRAFTLVLDAHFEPRVRDEEGGMADGLPPAREDDDPARVAEAEASWAVLSSQLREAVKVQSFRLEQDMIGGRRWDVATWTRCLKEHPLLVNFTRRLLWGVYDNDGALLAGFRTAEDQTLVDLEDREYHLPKGARIGVVHPLHLRDEDRLAWAQHFADYEIISPFPQLERQMIRATAEEREATDCVRFAKDRFKSGVIRDTLVRRGWERDPGTMRMFYRRFFPAEGVFAIVHMDPGVFAGSATYDVKDQTIPRIEFKKKGEKKMSTAALPLGEVPPVVFCEALLDVQEILVEQDA
jgi:hypothetical protein